MFFNDAFADDAASIVSAQPPFGGGVLPLVLVFVVFYFLVIRPNQKKIKEHGEMIKALRRGDKIITAGGVIGVISKVEDDNVLVVEIAENVKIRIMRDTVSNVMNKTPVTEGKEADGKAASKSDSK